MPARAAVDPSASSVRSGRSAWIAPGLGIVVAAVLVWQTPPWDRHLLAGGAYKYAPYLAPGEVDAALHAGALEYYKEGAGGTVSVGGSPAPLPLAIDGKVDASTGSDMLTQTSARTAAGIAARPAQDINIIGLGSGVTVDSALAAGTVGRADVVEISPEVVRRPTFSIARTAPRWRSRESG